MKSIRCILLPSLAALMVLIAIGPLLIPIPQLEGTVSAEQLADAGSRFIQVNGIQVHYKEAGQGDRVLILLHGFGSSVFSWHEVITPLAEAGYRVIAFDRPAYGLTSRPMPGEWTYQSPYSTQGQVDLTIALMDALNVNEAILVGHSAGGSIAAIAAAQNKERTSGLILVDAAIYNGHGTPAWIRPLLCTPQMRRLGPLLARRIARQGPDLMRTAWHDPTKITPETLAAYQAPLKAENWDRALWEATCASRGPDPATLLHTLTMPALVITGDSDTWVEPEKSRRLAAELADATLAVIPECGHVPQEECPMAWLEATLSYLRQLP